MQWLNTAFCWHLDIKLADLFPKRVTIQTEQIRRFDLIAVGFQQDLLD